MNSHRITLSESVSDMIRAQVATGRYKDISAAVQDAAWNYFVGQPSPFEEYGVTPAEVGRAHGRVIRQVRRERKAGKLKLWQP